jgi:D-amino-acid dehydrogenase
MAPLFEAARGLSPRIPPLSQARRWSGDRPSTPDSLPVIGPAPRDPRVLLAYGHGHLGLTLAAPTAALIADLVAGRRPAVDLAPYAADRPA